MLEDDPFFGPADEPIEPPSPEDGDSIFSVSRAPGKQSADPVAPPSGDVAQRPHVVPSGEPEPVAPEPVQEAAAPEPQMPQIDDPVLKMLVEHAILQADHVEQLRHGLPALPEGTPPWRAALALPGVQKEHVLAVAAHVHKIPIADLRENPVGMLRLTLESLPAPFKRQCHELGLLPFALELNGATGQLELKMAANDPLRPEVHAFLAEVQMKVRMHYSPLTMLNEAVQELAAEREERRAEGA